MEKRVTGIGGIFFKSENPDKTKEWYNKHLGLDTDQYGCLFKWRDYETSQVATTQWSVFKKDTDYFGAPDKEFMMNYRVENLRELLKVLKEEGVEVIDKVEEYEYGKFGWIIDPEGRKIELWEPIDAPFLEP